jgi:hypothetical protein
MYRDPEEWPIVQRLIQSAVSGRSWMQLTRDLNEARVPTSKGNMWTPASVRALLTNPQICGYRVLNGEIVNDEHGEPVVGRWDAPASPDQWRAVRERIRIAGAQRGIDIEAAERVPGSPATRSRRYLFSGFLRCGRQLEDGTICGGSMAGNRRKNRDGSTGFVYRCLADGKTACGRTARQGDAVDRYLQELVLQRLDAARVDTPAGPEPWSGADLLAKLELKASELRRRWRDLEVTDSLFYSEYPKIQERISNLRADQQHNARTEANRIMFSKNIRCEWASMDLAQRRAAVGRILLAVVVYPLDPGAPRHGAFDPAKLRPIWRAAAT